MQTITWHISIKNIFENNRISFSKQYGHLTRSICFKAVNDILTCKDSSRGFATRKCNHCSDIKRIAFSCKSRFCNSCWTPQSDLRMNRLLSRWPPQLHYYHLAFTIPSELRPFFKSHRSALKLLPKVASDSIIYFFRSKHKTTPGILSVIHTFWAKLNWNPHVHLIITSWWFDQYDCYKPISFIPYQLILPSWKKWLLRALRSWIKTNCSDPVPHLKLINSLYSQKDSFDQEKSRYIYFSKKAQSFQIVLSYIWRYLKRPTISQSRILAYDWSSVTFQYKDKYDSQDKTITCSALHFIWYLIQHIPNKYFHMIYYHGIFANRCKSKYLSLLKTYFNSSSKIPTIPTSFSQRLYFFSWKNPLACECWGFFRLYSLVMPGYPTKYFDSW